MYVYMFVFLEPLGTIANISHLGKLFCELADSFPTTFAAMADLSVSLRFGFYQKLRTSYLNFLPFLHLKGPEDNC